MKDSHITQIVRYVIAGFLGFVTNFSFYLLFLHIGFSYVAASVVGFCCGVVASFFAQKFFAFQNHSGKTSRQVLLHILLLTFNLGANTLIIMSLVEAVHMGKIVSVILTNGIIAAWSFFIYKKVVFLHTQEAHV